MAETAKGKRKGAAVGGGGRGRGRVDTGRSDFSDVTKYGRDSGGSRGGGGSLVVAAWSIMGLTV